MGYEATAYDSSGTDDDHDLPTLHRNRVPRGGRMVASGRPGLVGSLPCYGQLDANDMEAQIHQLEQDAYISVLKALKAQADTITWEKEHLMTELRKELRILDEEHRELLHTANEDKDIQKLRECRKALQHQSALHTTSQSRLSSPTISASQRKPKLNQLVPSHSFAIPSVPVHPLVATPSSHPSSAAVEQEFVMTTTNEKYKTEKVKPGPQRVKLMQHPTPCTSSRDRFPNQIDTHAINAADPMTRHSLIGRKVRTRWPEDNNFYEAIIAKYDPHTGRHALVYDYGTPKETWEWVNLSEITPDDIQWVGEDSRISCRGQGLGRGCEALELPGHVLQRSVLPDNIPGEASGGRDRGVGHAKKGFPPCHNGVQKKALQDIKLLHTETLIKKVEKMFSAGHPGAVEVERVKKVLRDHEKALVEAIAMITSITHGESAVLVSCVDGWGREKLLS